MNVIKSRQSNFELLRIVSMLMILNLHSFVGVSQLSYSQIDFFIIIDYLRESFSICAVNCFVLISGYFGISWKWKGFLGLVFQVYFYVIGLFLLLCIFGYSHFEIKTLVSRCNCLLVSYWFISAYLILYLVAPIFNAFVESKSRHYLLLFIIIYYCTQTYFSLIGPKYFNDCMNFFGLYLIGRFIKLHSVTFITNINIYIKLFYYILLSILISAFAIFQKIVTQSDETAFSLLGGVYSNPLVIFQSLFLFFVFHDLKITSKIINWLSISSLSVYLIHLSPDVKYYYIDFCKKLYDYNAFIHYSILIPFILVVFLVCIFIDKVRIYIWNSLYSRCKRIIKSTNL